MQQIDGETSMAALAQVNDISLRAISCNCHRPWQTSTATLHNLLGWKIKVNSPVTKRAINTSHSRRCDDDADDYHDENGPAAGRQAAKGMKGKASVRPSVRPSVVLFLSLSLALSRPR